MDRHVERLDAAAEALRPAAWEGLAGRGAPEEDVGWVLAYGATLSNPAMVISVWRDGRLRGCATAVIFEGTGRGRTMSIERMAGAGDGIRFVDGADTDAVITELLEAATQLCRDDGVSTLIVANCDAGDARLLGIAERLGFRSLPAPPDHRIDLDEPTRFTAFLTKTLDTRYRTQLRRDLRRAEETGAEVIWARPPSPSMLQRYWPLYLEKLERKRAIHGYHFRDNLFAALSGACRFARIEALQLLREGELVAFCLAMRRGTWWSAAFIGHVDDPGFHSAAALHACAIRDALDSGVYHLCFGPTEDRYKHRLGCVARPRVHSFLSVR